jgi:hypothetical protein
MDEVTQRARTTRVGADTKAGTARLLRRGRNPRTDKMGRKTSISKDPKRQTGTLSGR